MTRSTRDRVRAAADGLAGAAWIVAVVVAAAELFKLKKPTLEKSSARRNPAVPPPPPPARPQTRPVASTTSKDRASRPVGGPGTSRKRRWAVPLVATLVAGSLGLPGAFGLDLLQRDDEGPEAPRFTAVSAGVETSRSAKHLMKFRREVFDARPSPSPTPTPTPTPTTTPTPEASEEAVAAAPAAPAPAGSVEAIIRAAAERHGVSGDWMVSIAQCESGMNPNAVNPAGYYGLFQFSKGTWSAYGSGDIMDPAAQSEATASMLANGGSGHWPNCS